MSVIPVLYSFRRCPYAMRARMALVYSRINCIVREVDLKNKPEDLLRASTKATVPVLQFNTDFIFEESIDIVKYAFIRSNPGGIVEHNRKKQFKIQSLIASNDQNFSLLLRKYKYHENHPEEPQEYYREQIEQLFLKDYEEMLTGQDFLFSNLTTADFAIFPFIRQFALVDDGWFFNSKYKNLIKWVKHFNESEEFENIVMAKYKVWERGDKEQYLL